MKQPDLLKAWREGVLNDKGKDILISYLIGDKIDYSNDIKNVLSYKGLTLHTLNGEWNKMIKWDKRRKDVSIYKNLDSSQKNNLTRMFHRAELTEEQIEFLKYHVPDVLWKLFKEK